MKITFCSLILIFFLGCNNSGSSKTISNFSSNAFDTTFHTALQIGGLYSYQLNKDSIIGLILYDIRKEEDSIYYSFFMSGEVFKEKPGNEKFRKAGIWGRKIPFSDSKMFTISFNSFTISENSLRRDSSKLSLIERINISKKNTVAMGSYVSSIEEVVSRLSSYASMNKNINKEPSGTPEYPIEVFKFETLQQSADPEQMAQPRVVWRLTRKTAHHRAAEIMKEDWYWDEADDLSPFGNDEGSDAFYSFRDWRIQNPNVEPSLYFVELQNTWGLSFTHKDVTSEEELKEIETSNPFYHNVDAAIIAVALGQFALEGKMSARLKDLGIKAVNRTLSPSYLADFDSKNGKEYQRRLQSIKKIFENS